MVVAATAPQRGVERAGEEVAASVRMNAERLTDRHGVVRAGDDPLPDAADR